jgi:anti-anti-sigma factor
MTPVIFPEPTADPTDLPSLLATAHEEPLRIGVQRAHGRALVMVCGELDVATAPRLHAVLRDCADRREDITVDLSNLRFIDCSGLRPLVDAEAGARRQGRSFTIGTASAPVHRVLDLTRLTRLLCGGTAA